MLVASLVEDVNDTLRPFYNFVTVTDCRPFRQRKAARVHLQLLTLASYNRFTITP
jgi:hypothetical protein